MPTLKVEHIVTKVHFLPFLFFFLLRSAYTIAQRTQVLLSHYYQERVASDIISSDETSLCRLRLGNILFSLIHIINFVSFKIFIIFIVNCVVMYYCTVEENAKHIATMNKVKRYQIVYARLFY
jgi:hypothetical protein